MQCGVVTQVVEQHNANVNSNKSEALFSKMIFIKMWIHHHHHILHSIENCPCHRNNDKLTMCNGMILTKKKD